MVMDSISKRFSSCGARLGNLICPTRRHGDNETRPGPVVPPDHGPVRSSLDHRHLDDDILRPGCQTYQRRRDVLMEELDGVPGVFLPEAGRGLLRNPPAFR
jgi:aspartate/methionine/tyrosine aminotransferase